MSWSLSLGFVMDKLELGQFFLCVFQFSPTIDFIPQLSPLLTQTFSLIILPCDGVSSRVNQHPCLPQTFDTLAQMVACLPLV